MKEAKKRYDKCHPSQFGKKSGGLKAIGQDFQKKIALKWTDTSQQEQSWQRGWVSTKSTCRWEQGGGEICAIKSLIEIQRGQA